MKKTKYKDGGFLTKKTLNKIKQEVNKRKLIIYGSSGVGKTQFGNPNEKKIFIINKNNRIKSKNEN